MEGLGTGLAAIAFWGFLASVVVGGIWYGLRERQAQYATLQHLLDSGQPIDDAIVDKVLGGNRRIDLGLKVAAWVTLLTGSAARPRQAGSPSACSASFSRGGSQAPSSTRPAW